MSITITLPHEIGAQSPSHWFPGRSVTQCARWPRLRPCFLASRVGRSRGRNEGDYPRQRYRWRTWV